MPDGDDGGGGGANTANPPPRHHHHHRHHRSSDLRIDIGKHIKECFDLGAQMRPLLPVTGPLSNPAKKKLGKLMAAMKENIEEARKQSELLATEVSASIDDFHRLRTNCHTFHLLVELMVDTDMELLGCIKHVLPRRFSPGVLVITLQELSGPFKQQEPSHPHLLEQHRELVESAFELQKGYMRFLLPIVTMIHQQIKPACGQIFTQYCEGLGRVLCDYQKDRVLPRMAKVRRIGQGLWSVVCAVPEPADEVWAAKSGVYAQQLAAIVVEGARRRKRRAPERPGRDCHEHPGEHGNGISFNDIGAVLLAMIPTVLMVRLKAKIRGDEAFGGRIFGELLMLKKKIEVDRVKVRGKLMVQTWLHSPGLVVEKAKDIGNGKKVPMPKDYRKTEGGKGAKRAGPKRSEKPEQNKVTSFAPDDKPAETSNVTSSASDDKPAETSNEAEAKKKNRKKKKKKKKKKPTGDVDVDQVKTQGNGDLPPGEDV